MIPTWIWFVLASAVLVGVVLFFLKRIRRRERAELDAPDLVLTEEGKLTTVVPDRYKNKKSEDDAPE